MFTKFLALLLPLPLLTLGSSGPNENLDGSHYPRQVVKVLTVTNGKDWGNWERAQFCPMGTYTSGFELKVEKPLFGRGDDAAMNGISLKCVTPDTLEFYGTVSSQVGPWGDWGGMKDCLGSMGHQFFLVGFQMKVEKTRGRWGDDTSVNNVRFKCRLLNQYRTYPLETRGGPWGTWGTESELCPIGTAICGVQTRISPPEGNGDDTALEDLRLFCCKDYRVTVECANRYDKK